MYSAILVHALINFAPPNAAWTSLQRMNSACEPVYPERVAKVRDRRWVGLVSHAPERRSTITMYLILGHSHCFLMVDLRSIQWHFSGPPSQGGSGFKRPSRVGREHCNLVTSASLRVR